MVKLIEFVNHNILPEEAAHALARAKYSASLRSQGIVLSDAQIDQMLVKSMAERGLFDDQTMAYLRKTGKLQPACPQLVVVGKEMPPSLSQIEAQLEVAWARGHSSERIKNLPQRGHLKTLKALGLLVR
jgi:hypothetical protein